jgi:hypothetical protein
MPGVKKLYQSSQNNSKPAYIWGHSCQGLSILAGKAKHLFAIPLKLRIHEGLGRKGKSIILKSLELTNEVLIPNQGAYLIGDAYYFSGELSEKLSRKNIHLISRVRSNAVAYELCEQNKKSVGRPRLYGKKLKLSENFKGPGFVEESVPLYGEKEIVKLKSKIYRSKSHKMPLLYVFVKRSKGNPVVFASTDTELEASKVVELYGYRFKIEVSFKEFVQRIGGFAYRFWSKKVGKRRVIGEEKRDIHKEQSYHVHLQSGVIAQGLLQYLALAKPELVWEKFNSWLRTIRNDVIPTEQIVAMAMRDELSELNVVEEIDSNIAKLFKSGINSCDKNIFREAG